MSAQAVTSGIDAPDLLAASQRVQQLQTLVSEAGRGAPTASFAAALAAAAAPGSASASSAAASGLTPTPTAATAPALPSTESPIASSTLSAATPVAYSGAVGASYPASGLAVPSGAPDASAGASAYDSLVSQAAVRYGLDPAVLHGLIQQESGFNADSRSSAGAAGLTQLMPGTASAMGVKDPLNPAESIEGGARYLSQLMAEFGGNTTSALAAYNAGPGAVSRYGGVPPYAETQDYVSKVLGYATAYRQSQTTLTSTTTDPGQIT